MRAMEHIAQIEYSEGLSNIYLASKEEILPDNTDLAVFDGNTAALIPERNPERSIALPPGEAAKNWQSVERIINRALSLSMARDSLMVGFGGGVVTDVTAFAASIYMRGCSLILVPTTLLAMIDASIGGKTGFDYGGVKNLLGTFYMAGEVRICPELLKTLPEDQFRSGMSEVIKHALLDSSTELLDLITNEKEAVLNRDSLVLRRLITLAVKVKTDIVSEDFKEKGKRAFLNLGHTFGHALESATNFSRWSHGDAVAWGILRSLELGERLGITDKVWAEKVRKIITEYGFDIVTPQVAAGEIKKAMNDDKKKKNGRLRFVMMKSQGEPVLKEVPEKDIDAVLGI